MSSTARLRPLEALQQDPEQSSTVIGRCDEGRDVRARPRELAEGLVALDVVGDDRSPAHRAPCALELEAKVAGGVAAVVNEQIDLAELGEQRWKSPSAGPVHVRPARAQIARHRGA